MNKKMRAVLFYAPKKIRLVDVPMPVPGPGEVLLQVGSALTCGTDFKAYRQGHHMLGEPPSPFGHELAGVVVAAGDGVSSFALGDRVVAANSAPCDRCYFCAAGQNQLCDNLRLHNGAYAEYNLVPARIVKHNLYHLPARLDFPTAALSEPLACAIHAVDVLRVREGETAALIGAGPMSLLLIQALAARGARIVVVGRNSANLALALKAGAHEAISAEEKNPVMAVREATERRGADCVFEAVGKPETWLTAIDMVRKGGRVCLFGGCASGTVVPIDAHRVHYGQISLHGVFHHTPKYFRAAVDLLSQGRVKTDILISGRIALDEVPSFFDSRHGQSNPKVAVIP
ncbi:MAG: zinc-binding dehydrogenase [Elusimicrobia bacterium]|nr:zinc-binding dehydrogenase [Elusimicrobiota bacterium]